MPTLTYTGPSGTTTVEVPVGWSLMQAATANGVEDILGECGGSCACATCHCYLDEQLTAAVPPASDAELAMLEHVAAERRPNSRLSCQVKACKAMDGGTITLPETQE